MPTLAEEPAAPAYLARRLAATAARRHTECPRPLKSRAAPAYPARRLAAAAATGHAECLRPLTSRGDIGLSGNELLGSLTRSPAWVERISSFWSSGPTGKTHTAFESLCNSAGVRR